MGCVHIYCGDGKGKTSAAVGLAVRAAGRGKKIVVVRFLKTDDSGEVEILKTIPQITVKFLKDRPEALEVVMTGRGPSEQLLSLADYVSEIRKMKHPYDKGILARKGIEY